MRSNLMNMGGPAEISCEPLEAIVLCTSIHTTYPLAKTISFHLTTSPLIAQAWNYGNDFRINLTFSGDPYDVVKGRYSVVGGGKTIDTGILNSGGFALGRYIELTTENSSILSPFAPTFTLDYKTATSGTWSDELSSAGGTFSSPKPVVPPGNLAGFVFNDVNGNGIQTTPNETHRSGVKVFLDTDRDHKIDAGEKVSTTDGDGRYSFSGLTPKTYRVEVVPPSGFRVSTLLGAYTSKQVLSGATSQVDDFGLTQRSSVAGTLFQDADGDGKHDSGEAGLAGWRVYDDSNGDKRFGTGEESYLTDASGNWNFSRLVAGTHSFRVVMQPGYERTTASVLNINVGKAATITGKLFGCTAITATIGLPASIGGHTFTATGGPWTPTDQQFAPEGTMKIVFGATGNRYTLTAAWKDYDGSALPNARPLSGGGTFTYVKQSQDTATITLTDDISGHTYTLLFGANPPGSGENYSYWLTADDLNGYQRGYCTIT